MLSMLGNSCGDSKSVLDFTDSGVSNAGAADSLNRQDWSFDLF